MTTLDDILKKIAKDGYDKLNSSIPLRDIKILKNITRFLDKDDYITEPMARLVVKIFNENLAHLIHIHISLENLLENPKWKKKFRTSIKLKQVCIEKDFSDTKRIAVKYDFDKKIVNTIKAMHKIIVFQNLGSSKNHFFYKLTEKNIITIFNLLKSHEFDFSDEFLDLVGKIEEIDKKEINEKINFKNLFESKLETIIQAPYVSNNLLILDQKIRYQYTFEHDFDQKFKENLSYKIANRQLPKVYMNTLKFNFKEILNSLTELHRNKILLIFDDNDPEKTTYTMKSIVDFIKNKNTGIYFRFDNKGLGKDFNEIINQHKLNLKLDETTDVVGLGSSKVPKFLLKSDWSPDAVITFTNSLRNNKTDVYCNECDLIVYYTNIKPIISNVHEIL